VITGDLDRALATAIGSAGTWRPAPPGTVCGFRTYVTTIAFWLARGHAGGPGACGPGAGGPDADGPAAVAAGLAARLSGLDWVEAAAVTGGGYLAATVTADALAGLAVRITEAGSGCARGSALAGTSQAAPAVADLTSASTWDDARRRVHATATGRLAEAAGAHVSWQQDAERITAPYPAAPVTAGPAVGSPVPSAGAVLPGPVLPGPVLPGPGLPPGRVPSPGPVAEAVAYAGADAITYALARLLPRGPARVDARRAAAHHLGNPAYAVQYAHAHAASALRQAADLGLGRGEAAEFQPRLLAHPSEEALLSELSWLPERVAGAARRARPDVLTHFLECLARAYLDCQETCPAVRPGMVVPDGTDRSPAGRAAVQAAAARLWLAAAARTALGAGLGLLGVGAPDRL
jgi:arginyl-tRNA synthetase